jgi:hypothetical protein
VMGIREHEEALGDVTPPGANIVGRQEANGNVLDGKGSRHRRAKRTESFDLRSAISR